MKTLTVSFEMDQQDYENLLSIVHEDYVKCKFDSQCRLDLNDAEKAWYSKHGDYVKKQILDKIIKGTQSK